MVKHTGKYLKEERLKMNLNTAGDRDYPYLRIK